MKNLLRITLIMGFMLSSTASSYAADELQIVQVEQVLASSLSVDTSKPFSWLLTATLISENNLSAPNRDSNVSEGSIVILCEHTGNFDAKVEVVPLGGNRYKFTCEITDTPLSKSMPPSMEEISILMSDARNTVVIPKSILTFKKEQKDTFGTKTTVSLPLSTALSKWGVIQSWTFGLAVNPPANYVFPSYPTQDKAKVVYAANDSKLKTTFTLNAKKRTLNVKCPNSTPSFSLGGAKSKVVTRLLIGNIVVGGPSWNFNYPRIPGTTQMVSCLSQTVLTNHSGQIIGYSESAPVSVKFPK